MYCVLTHTCPLVTKQAPVGLLLSVASSCGTSNTKTQESMADLATQLCYFCDCLLCAMTFFSGTLPYRVSSKFAQTSSATWAIQNVTAQSPDCTPTKRLIVCTAQSQLCTNSRFAWNIIIYHTKTVHNVGIQHTCWQL